MIIEEFECDIVLSDDGLQHYALHRDVEIVVIDSIRGFGNEYIIPAGPLREPLERLNEAHFLVHNGKKEKLEDSSRDIHVSLRPIGLRNAKTHELVHHADWQNSLHVKAVAGIGNPESFARTLFEMGFSPTLIAKNDHESLTPEDIFSENPDEAVVVTEKDIVKYRGEVPDNLWVLEVEMPLSKKFIDDIDDKKIHIITDKPNMELPSIILKFSEKAIKIEDIHIPQTSLEDVFLDLTGRKIND